MIDSFFEKRFESIQDAVFSSGGFEIPSQKLTCNIFVKRYPRIVGEVKQSFVIII